MSDFGASEASEASSLSSAELSDAEIPTKKLKRSKNKKKKRIQQSSDEESDSSNDEISDEEELIRKEAAGWIVDEAEESDKGDESDKSSKSGTRKDQSDLEEDLDEDDFDLIQENVGVNLKRKKKRKLLMEDDEVNDFADKTGRNDFDMDREKIAREIFANEEEESDGEPSAIRQNGKSKPAFDMPEEGEEEEEEADEDDMDDFIVDDAGSVPQRRKKTSKSLIHKDAALQEAQEIFGVDFDFTEFEKYENGGLEMGEEDEESDEYDSELEEEEIAARAAMRRAKRLPKDVLEKNVKEMFDPSDLDRAFFNPVDEKIRKLDVPERFQLRTVPVKLFDETQTTEELAELSEESDWIYVNAFRSPPDNKPPAAKTTIAQCLKLLREGHEVPFIAFYRKESMKPDLNIADLWKIYDFDEKWTELQRSKKSLIKVLQRLTDFFEFKSNEGDETSRAKAMNSKSYVIKLIAQIKSLVSMEEINDVRQYYLLHFSSYTDEVRKWEKSQKKPGEEEEEGVKDEDEGANKKDEIDRERMAIEKSLITLTLDPQTGRMIKQKRQRTNAPYELAFRANIGGLVKRFGLSAMQFGQNVNDQYMRHDVDQCPMLPLEAAKDFLSPQFPTADSALRAARYMLAFEIAREPNVLRTARQTLKTQTVVNVAATKKGHTDIDESHPLYPVKYLKEKPISELMFNPLFLHIHNGQKDGLLNVELKQLEVRGCTLFDEFRRFFTQDEFSSLVQAWNAQRDLVLREALDTFLLPQLLQEIQKTLLKSSEQATLKMCASKLFNYLQVAPYTMCTDDTEESSRKSKHREMASSCGPGKSARIMAVALKDHDQNHSAQLTAVMLDSNGEVVDFCHSPGFMVPASSLHEDLKKQRLKDIQALSSFISRHSPQAIVVGCDCRKSIKVKEGLQELCDSLLSERRLGRVKVELADTEPAQVFANSPRAMSELPQSYTQLMRVAISLGRRLQDPLSELAQLMNYDQDILALRLHPLQDSLPKEAIWRVCETEFVNRVNEVGVDVNRCLDHPHTSHLLQFVSGFGPRKAAHMLKTMKQNKIYLCKRTQLVTDLKLGTRIMMNCAGFIRIDIARVKEFEEQLDILDSTRVHLESYELARKMAIDALEYDESEDNDPNEALEEIIQSPARLRELDLDAFADELKNKGHGDKSITLYDIRAELNHRYKDLRQPFQSLNSEQIFIYATGETPETLHRGKLVECRVNSMAMRRPRGEQLDSANPQRSSDSGLWMCPFCRRNDFQQLNFVWAHFDNNECPGEP
ncbi:Transcription elongation factor SPT6, partial [Cichlidogyrus casuarinus]